MSGNKNLSKARSARMDEFYTQRVDIENELLHYKKHFKGKTVLCNCDDPYESQFFKYFVLKFNELGLKKIIATCYIDSPISHKEYPLFEGLDETGEKKEEEKKKRPYKAIVTTVYDKTKDGGIDMEDVKALFESGENILTELKGDGDFRSDECLALLDEADIVVTNPPFSLFREYVALLVEHKKSFIILGNKNALTYKEIFPLIQNNELWVGATPMSAEIYFQVPADHAQFLREQKRDRSIILHKGEWVARASAIWFTNLDIKKRHEEIVLYEHYDPEKYPKYDNYDAIEVGKTS
ncbi:MAG: hypothetical protein IK077_08645, partial [Thermoguttaceae bacterium]|nr:hypothetical protein [Thermoguttaceae bacterium]